MDTNDFDGVFKFSNPTDLDFTVLWNNKEYTFLANTTVPMRIPNETPENVQEIRKKFAFKLAVREFHRGRIMQAGKTYDEMKEMGKGLPPTYDEKILEPMIEQCLKPLPVGKMIVKDAKKSDDSIYKSSKAFTGNVDLSKEFADAPVQVLGEMAK